MAERRKRIDLYVGPAVDVPRERLPELEATGEWVAEVKHDGEWALATVEGGVLVEIVSRTGLPHTDSNMVGDRLCAVGSGMLVGELVADQVSDGGETTRTGARRLHLFEPVTWNGIDLRDLPLEERREALEMIWRPIAERALATAGDPRSFDGRVHLVERRGSGFLAWYDELLAGDSRVIGARAEGLVLKKRGTPARATRSDGKVDFWLRCKPSNTVDYVVIGPDGAAEKGTPKIALGLYKDTKDGRRLVKVMSPTWPPRVLDQKGCVRELTPGTVVEVEGKEVFPSGAVRHGHIKRARTDKSATDCTYEAALEVRP